MYGGGPGSSGQHTVKAKGIISHVCIHNGIVQITHFSRTPFDILQAHLYSIQSVHKHQSPWIGIGPTCTQFPTLFIVRFYHNKFARFPSSTSKPFHCCTSLDCHASRWAPLRGILQKKKKKAQTIYLCRERARERERGTFFFPKKKAPLSAQGSLNAFNHKSRGSRGMRGV